MRMQKMIDLTEYGAEYDLQKSLAYGWRIVDKGLTYITLELEVGA